MEEKKSPENKKGKQNGTGMNFIRGFLLVLAFAVSCSLFKTSILEYSKYSAMANDNQFGSTTVKAARGSIYDANGKILAQSATVYNLIIAPAVITGNKELTEEDKELRIKNLAQILSSETDCEYSDIIAIFNDKKKRDKQYVKVTSGLEKNVVSDIKDMAKEAGLPSNLIFTETGTKRYYPQGEMASAVIGFTNFEGDGIYGVESYYNDYLAGIDGKQITATDAQGNEMPYKDDKTYSAKNGGDVYLTIDSTLQYYVERELNNCVLQNNVQNRACAIIMNAKTGAILAMASAPGFDLNDRNSIYSTISQNALAQFLEENPDDEKGYEELYAQFREMQWKNKAITEIYEPGSVFKVVTGSSALEEKVVGLNSTFVCQHSIEVADRTINCWTRGAHGTQDFTTAMTNSCNPAFVRIGQALGKHKFSEYYEAYGFTEPTGIDLPGESQGLFYTEDKMGIVELASCSFGQSNSVTPIQMITAYAAAINGGYLMKPYVCEKIVDSNGNIVKTEDGTVRRQVISEETSELMRGVLESVVNNNGGSNAYIKGYRIGGKSGTGQKLQKSRQTGDDNLYVSSYVGFAPANDPEIVMLCMVDEPKGYQNGSLVYYGSMVAAPVVSAVFKDALPYLGYYPEYTETELAALDITVPSVEGLEIDIATELIEKNDLQYLIIGNGATVVAQVPPRSSSIPRNGKVILYTEKDYETEYTTVPDVVGQSLSSVSYQLTNANLNFRTGDGAANHEGATAYAQNYRPGDIVPVGTVIEVTFIVKNEG